MNFQVLICAVALCVLLSGGNVFADELATAEETKPIGKTVMVHVPPQQWETEQSELIKTIKGAQAQDPDAVKAFDQILTNFEKHPMSRTPPENNLILGFFYVPKDGAIKALPVVVQNQILGWYDVLRFGSASGRAEILNNAHFFISPFMVGGKEAIQKNVQELQRDSEQTQAAIQVGLKLADIMKEKASYDRHWPTAFGLERMQCGLGAECKLPAELPQDQWDGAWEQAKQRILAYYLQKKSVD